MNPDEMYVRERWASVVAGPGSSCNSAFGITLPVIWWQSLASGFFNGPAEAWQAARAFTEQREEEIRQVEEEIALLNAIHLQLRFGQGQWHPFDRILAREQAALAELTRGMVGDGK